MKVEIVSYNQLPKGINKDDLSNCGVGKGRCNYLVISDGNEIASVQSDAMESEDATFTRGLNWIPSVLKLAYGMGYCDAQKKQIK